MAEKKSTLDTTDISFRNVVRYWRTSISDSVLEKGRYFRQWDFDTAKFINLSEDELSNGVAAPETLERMYKEQNIKAGNVDVCLRPLLFKRTGQLGRLPLYVTPIATRALITPDGKIWPGKTVIPRDMLEPLPAGAFFIGNIEDLDRFLLEDVFSPAHEGEPHAEVWERFRDDCRNLFREVANGWPGTDGDFVQCGERGIISVSPDKTGFIKGILELYDDLISNEPACPLLESFAAGRERALEACIEPPYELSRQLAHGTNEYPLADKQRDVLIHLAAAGDGETIAVNGPPGTGKTTMLLSVIASEWVRAAAAGEEPPVIAAASTNNQAVTNIIDAFAKDFATGEGSFAGRWLPDIASYGLYLPSRSREDKASEKYQTEAFFRSLETEDYVRAATDSYLDSAGRALTLTESQ